MKFTLKYSKPAVSEMLLFLLLTFTLLRTIFVISSLLYVSSFVFLILIVINLHEISVKVKKQNGVNFIMLYGLWALLSTLWSLWAAVTIQRSVYLLLVIVGLYAMSLNKSKNKIKNFFTGLFVLNAVVVAVQLLSLVSGLPEKSWRGGNALGFMGIFSHQNTAAAVLLFTLPGVIFYLATLNNHKTTAMRLLSIKAILGILVFLANIVFIYLSSSRSAILSLFILLISFGTLNSDLRKMMKWGAACLMLLGSLYFISPSVQTEVTFLIYKNSSSPTSTRLPMYVESLKAAKHGGIIGLGFGVSDPSLSPLIGHYEKEHFVREKGNSILALIEETGFVGLTFYLIFYAQGFSNLLKRLRERKAMQVAERITLTLLTAFLLAAFVHAQFEAWWGGIASFPFMVFIYSLLLVNNLVDMENCGNRKMEEKISRLKRLSESGEGELIQ